MRLVAVAACVGAAAVCYKHKVILDKVYCLLFAVLDVHNLLGNLLVAFLLYYYVFDVNAVFHRYAVRFKVLYKGQNHAFVLVVFGKAQCGEVGQSVDVVHVAAQVTLHFKRA